MYMVQLCGTRYRLQHVYMLRVLCIIHSFIPVLHPFGSHSDLISPLNVQVLHKLHASYFQLHSVGSQISSAVSPVIPTILPTLIAILPGIRWCSLVFSGVALC